MVTKMNITDIEFPNLGLHLSNVPKTFNVFGFGIALYGIIIAIAMLVGTLTAAKMYKKDGKNPELVWDFIIFGIIFGVIGARLYYVIFQWDYYKDNLLKIFNLREGGLAIYGGVIAAFITVFVFSKVKKIEFFDFLDSLVPGLILGQAIGRWGNFFNREVFGQYSDGLLAMRLPIDAVRGSDITPELAAHITPGANYIDVHPTFLYESLWNIGVFLLIFFLRSHKKFAGEMALLYLGGYGLGRAWIEGIRTDQLFIHGTTIPVSQVLAIALAVGSLITEIVVRIIIAKKPKKEEEIANND